MRDFPVPNIGTAAVHSAVPALDGSVWLAEQGSNKSEDGSHNGEGYRIPGPISARERGIEDGDPKHTIRLDASGKVWTSGVPLTRFDPETGKFTRFREGEYAYDVKPDKNGDVWLQTRGQTRSARSKGKQ